MQRTSIRKSRMLQAAQGKMPKKLLIEDRWWRCNYNTREQFVKPGFNCKPDILHIHTLYNIILANVYNSVNALIGGNDRI